VPRIRPPAQAEPDSQPLVAVIKVLNCVPPNRAFVRSMNSAYDAAVNRPMKKYMPVSQPGRMGVAGFAIAQSESAKLTNIVTKPRRMIATALIQGVREVLDQPAKLDLEKAEIVKVQFFVRLSFEESAAPFTVKERPIRHHGTFAQGVNVQRIRQGTPERGKEPLQF
jgi:hypothetical protein